MEFVRDEAKDEIVKQRVGGCWIGFEDVVRAFANGQLLYDGTNDGPYWWQSMMIVALHWYPYKVPYIQLDANTRKLITLFPYRKFKSYL